MKWRIYALKDPRTKLVRYVGWTRQSMVARLGEHIADSVSSQKTHKQKWILSMLSIGIKPTAEILQEGEGAGWAEAEQYWIKRHRSSGAKLTNGTDGGDGIIGLPSQIRAQACLKRVANIGPERLSEIARKREANKTPEQRRKTAQIARRYSRATSEEISNRMKKTQSLITSERRSEWAKAAWAKRTVEERKARMVNANAARSSESRRQTMLSVIAKLRQKKQP